MVVVAREIVLIIFRMLFCFELIFDAYDWLSIEVAVRITFIIANYINY